MWRGGGKVEGPRVKKGYWKQKKRKKLTPRKKVKIKINNKKQNCGKKQNISFVNFWNWKKISNFVENSRKFSFKEKWRKMKKTQRRKMKRMHFFLLEKIQKICFICFRLAFFFMNIVLIITLLPFFVDLIAKSYLVLPRHRLYFSE